MAQVKVWNDNVHPYNEQFRDQKIHIPAKSFIKMEAGEAHLFKGTFAPIKVDGDGNPIPEGYKMIRIEEITSEKELPTVSTNKCQACAYEASSDKDLAEHLSANHTENRLVDAEAEREIAVRKKRA